MPAVETVNLILLGEPHDVSAEPLESETSPHTGRELRRVHVSFRVAAEESAAISDVLTKAREAENALEGDDGSRWVVTHSSYSYQEGDRVHHHGADLREVEELKAERLEFLGLVLKPKRYEEDSRDGGIVIIARVDLDADADESLERELAAARDDPYFDVTRVGVSDTPIRMRFGRCLWQKTDGGRAHLLRLVSEAGDAEERQRGLMLFEPELSHLKRKAAAVEEVMDALLTELQTAGILSASAMSAVRDRAQGAWAKRARDFDESGDLDLHS